MLRTITLSFAIVLAAPVGAQEAPPEPAPYPLPTAPEQQVAIDPDYPAEAVLAEFEKACAQLGDFEAARMALATSGWDILPREADTPISALARVGAEMAAELPGATPIRGFELRKHVGGRTLYLSLSGSKVREATEFGCRFYDFDAVASLSPETLESWSGRSPTPQSMGITGGVSYIWAPGLVEGHSEMEFAFFPPDAPELVALPFKLSGIVLTTSLMEFAE